MPASLQSEIDTVRTLAIDHGWGMKKKVARLAPVLFCLLTAHTAAAAELGFYVGGQIGQSSKDAPRDFYELFNDDIQAFESFTPTEDRTSFEDSDMAFAIVTGYRLTSYLAFEGGFTNYGEVTYKSRATGNYLLEGGTLNTNIESKTSGFNIAVIGTLPLTRDWELFARGGVLFATNKIRLVVTATGQRFIPAPGSFDVSGTENTTETFAAIGISRRVFENYDLRLEYQRVFDAGTETAGGQADLNAALLGLNVTF